MDFSLFDELSNWDEWRERRQRRRGGSVDTSPVGSAHRGGLESVAEIERERELGGEEGGGGWLRAAEGPWE